MGRVASSERGEQIGRLGGLEGIWRVEAEGGWGQMIEKVNS